MSQGDILGKRNFLGRRLRCNQLPDGLQHLPHIEIAGIQLHLAALDLGHIQNVVDQPQQIIGGGLDLLQAVHDPLRALPALERDGRHADDAVHRRADLVAHAGEKLGLGLAGNIVLPLVQLALDDPAQLRQVLLCLRVLQKRPRDVQNTDISHIAAAVIHGQNRPLLARPHIQEALEHFLAAVLRGEIPHLALAQPAEKRRLLLLFILSDALHHVLSALMPLIIQIVGVEIRPQQGYQNAAGLIVPADLPDHQHHLRGEVSALSKEVQRHGYQAHILTVSHSGDLMGLQRRQGGALRLRKLPVEQGPSRGTGMRGVPRQFRHADQLLHTQIPVPQGQTGPH